MRQQNGSCCTVPCTGRTVQKCTHPTEEMLRVRELERDRQRERERERNTETERQREQASEIHDGIWPSRYFGIKAPDEIQAFV